jgi:hypothetical protein
MNFIAGMLLLFMDEEPAFWLLTTVVEDLLPGYYNRWLLGSKADVMQFKARAYTLCLAVNLTRKLQALEPLECSLSGLRNLLPNRSFQDIVKSTLPRLAAHCSKFSYDIGIPVSKWFLSLFIPYLPTEVRSSLGLFSD